MFPFYLLGCLIGLALLARAADELVLGSSALSERVGVPSLVVGVIVIGFGTSAPEFLVSALAAASGSAAIGVGNVVGSNIANLTLVLGAAALVAPIAVHARVIRREVPLTLLASAAFGLALQGGLSRREGVLLLVLLAVALGLLLRWALRPRPEPTADVRAYVEPDEGGDGDEDDGDEDDGDEDDGDEDDGDEGDAELAADLHELLAEGQRRTTARLLVQAGLGLLGTLAGAQALVWGAVGVARAASLPEWFVGVTVVAVGTSLPELVTAVQASRRGEPDLIVGNLLGSNLFNALGVGGVVALISPGEAGGPGLTVTGVLVMMGVSVLALGFMWRRFTVLRWEAATLIAVYVAALSLMAGG